MTLKPLALWAAGLLALLLVAGAGYFSLRVSNRQAAAPVHSLRPDDPQVLRVGARIYAQQCAACHGARSEGQPSWRDRGPDGLLPAPPQPPAVWTVPLYPLSRLPVRPSPERVLPLLTDPENRRRR